MMTKMKFVSACGALAMLGGTALAEPKAEPELTTFTPEQMREWLVHRGAAGMDAKAETVEVDLVFNFMKGVGCTEAEAKAAADAAAKKANELLKGACVKVNVKEINNDWTGPGNMDDPMTPQDEADGEVNEAEIRKAKKEGLKEVTGDDGAGGTKKGYKVFIVKDFVGGLDDTLGCTIKCEPWTAIQKNAPSITTGEILAHEIGHSFGKLDDTYEMKDMNCLMYGRAKEGSERKLKEGEGDKIREGAKGAGRVVKKQDGAPPTDPKTPKPKVSGSMSKLESEPIVNPAGEVVFGTFSADLPGSGTDADGQRMELTLVRDFSSPDPTFIHMGIDADGDPATGVAFGPWNGVEYYVLVEFNPLVPKGVPLGEVRDLQTGLSEFVFIQVGDGLLYTDGFPLLDPPAPLLPINEVVLGWHQLPPVAVPMTFGPTPGLIQGFVSPQPDPLLIPLPQDDFFEIPILPDDFFGRPILQMPGLGGPGDVLPIEGFGFPPVVPVQIFIDDINVGVVNTDPLGQFFLPLPLPPMIFGPDTFDYSFVTAKAQDVGPSGFTWFEHDTLPCPQDLNGDGLVNAADLAILLAAWGPNAGHIADFNGDGLINAADLAILLAAWGPCP